MALPRKLKNMNLFNDGISYAGQIEEVVPPVLTRIMEEFRAGGMNAPVKTDHGMEALSHGMDLRRPHARALLQFRHHQARWCTAALCRVPTSVTTPAR